MKKELNTNHLQQKSLKQNPFRVPEGYFEGFSEKLRGRIQEGESQIPGHRIGSTTRFRVAMAAALLGVALISYSILKFTVLNNGTEGHYSDLILLEQLQVIDDDSYLIELMGSEVEAMDEEEAFATQAMDYLAINDVEMVLLFE